MRVSKSCEEYVLGLYRAMFFDIAEYDPRLLADSRRDYKRLLLAVDQLGVRFILLTLPAFGKHFDRCLSNGRLIKSGLDHFGPFRHDVVIPRLFKGLLLRVFDDYGCLRSDPSVECIRFIRQLCSAAKRFRVPCPDSSTWEHVHEFFGTDSEIVSSSLDWDSSDLGLGLHPDCHFGDLVGTKPDCSLPFGDDQSTPSILLARSESDTLQWVSDAICAKIGQFNPTEWRAKHGPGAVSDVKSGEFKYSFPNWSEKLNSVFPMDLFGFANYDHWIRWVESGGVHSSYLDHEPPSKLIAVPKAYAGPRLICSEPTSHQWCQQIIKDFLISRVKDSPLKHCISFSDQSFNQDLARDASRSGTHATIDLSQASDRISCWAIERLFRRLPSLLAAFHAVRTRWVRQDIDSHSPRFHRLRKFSTMGSALTFPVQTIMFSIVAISAVIISDNLPKSYKSITEASRRVRVYGDDIIVPVDAYGVTHGMLSALGLKVNPAKTFATGKFRESCGYEGYDGHSVTKVSIMDMPSVSKPESILSSLDVHNNLVKSGYCETARYIRTTVERLGNYKFREVPLDSGAIGWYSAYVAEPLPYNIRYNPVLQRREVRNMRPCGLSTRTPVDSNSMVLQYFTEVHSLPRGDETRLGVMPLRHPIKLRRVWEPYYI